MPTFIVERDIPGAHDLTRDDLCTIASKSNEAVASLDVPYRWITSYVANDKFYCVHEAPNPDVIREHARRGGFPVNKISEVTSVFGPETAKEV